MDHRRPRSPLTFAWAALACLMLMGSGCESVRPQNVSEGIAAAFVAIESTAETVAAARDAGHLDEEKVAAAKTYLQRAHDLADAALVAYDEGAFEKAQSNLTRAKALIASASELVEGFSDGTD